MSFRDNARTLRSRNTLTWENRVLVSNYTRINELLITYINISFITYVTNNNKMKEAREEHTYHPTFESSFADSLFFIYVIKQSDCLQSFIIWQKSPQILKINVSACQRKQMNKRINLQCEDFKQQRIENSRRAWL